MDTRELLLAKRIPPDQIILGRAYVIHARNGGVGVAVRAHGNKLGYQLHREKYRRHYLFIEYDWAADDTYGTAIPLSLIYAEPPTGEMELLAWLTEREHDHRDEIKAAWDVVLGHYKCP